MMTGVKGSFGLTRVLDLERRLESGDAEQLLERAGDFERAIARQVGGDDRGGEARHVLHHRHAVTVVDDATRGDHGFDSELVERRPFVERVSVDQLQMCELRRERGEGDEDDDLQKVQLALELYLRVGLFGVLGSPSTTAVVGQ